MTGLNLFGWLVALAFVMFVAVVVNATAKHEDERVSYRVVFGMWLVVATIYTIGYTALAGLPG